MTPTPQPDPNSPPLTAADPAVHSYLDTLQNIIARMASNSSNCKTWCITLVSAILVVIVDKKIPNYLSVAFIPVILFFFLDSYYLAQEKAFRDIYTDFVKKLHDNQATSKNLFVIHPLPGGKIAEAVAQAVPSFSIWPFYLVLTIVLVIAYCVIK